MKNIYIITQGFCRELAKRARKGRVAGISFAIFAALAVTLYAQGSGTPSTLIVKTDVNGYLIASGVAQTNPVTSSVFNNTRLKTDSNGYLLVVVSGGTFTGPFFGPVESSCATVAYSFTGRTTTGLNSHASNTWNLCGGGTLGLSGNTTSVTSSLPLLVPVGSVSAPTLTFTGNTGNGFWNNGVRISLSTGDSSGAGLLLYDPSFNSGKSDPTDQKLYGFLNLNNWSAIGGLRVQGRSGSGLNASSLELSGWINTTQNDTYPPVIITGGNGIEGDAFNYVSATKKFFNICNGSGAGTWCDRLLWGQLGSGAVTHNILSDVSGFGGITTTSTVGYNLNNPVTATSGTATQWSPAFSWCGTAWKVNATAAAQTDCFKAENQTLTGATVTTAIWKLRSSIASASYNDVLTVTDTGLVTATSFNANSKSTYGATSDKLTQINDNANATGMEINVGTPTLGTCTGGTMVSGSHNFGGEVTGNTSGSCIINFGTPTFTNTPFCMLNDEGSLTAIRISARSASSITVTGVPSGEAFQFMCLGRIGT